MCCRVIVLTACKLDHYHVSVRVNCTGTVYDPLSTVHCATVVLTLVHILRLCCAETACPAFELVFVQNCQNFKLWRLTRHTHHYLYDLDVVCIKDGLSYRLGLCRRAR